jgi:2'-5' RNA ligase
MEFSKGNDGDKKKLFLAIPVPEEIISGIIKDSAELKFPGKITSKENLHITLHFFGYIETARLPEIQTILNEIAAAGSGFSLEFRGYKYKKGFHPMVWGIFQESNGFRDLALKIRIEFNDADRRFIPHITISRVKGKAEFPSFTPVKGFHNVYVKHFELWESEVSQAGSKYSVLQRYELKGGR